MEVLILSTNRTDQPVTVMPYGACLVADAAERAGHRVRFIDLMHATHPARTLQSALSRQVPDVVGISVRNIDNNDLLSPVAYHRELSPLIQVVRSNTNAPVVLGGPAVGVMTEALLRYTGADLAIPRDGETVFPAALKTLENGGKMTEVPGTAWIEDGALRFNNGQLADLSRSSQVADFHRWLDMGAYRSRMATVPLQSKRGCPFECVYCTYGISEGNIYRLCPPADVAESVRELAFKGARDIEFVDNVFNAPYDHSMEVCDHLCRLPTGARLLSMEINPGFLDGPLVKAMESAGFSGIGITAESAAGPVLTRLAKGFHADHVHRAAETIRRSNLPCFWIFMLGGPGETHRTVLETIRFAESSLRPRDAAFFNVGVRIYPGTALESIARDEGILEETGDDLLNPLFYFSPDVDLPWVLHRLSSITARNLNILNPASLSHPWLPAVHRVARRLPIRGPLWRHTGTIRRIVRFLGRDI